jgi:hypothetical protein
LSKSSFALFGGAWLYRLVAVIVPHLLSNSRIQASAWPIACDTDMSFAKTHMHDAEAVGQYPCLAGLYSSGVHW